MLTIIVIIVIEALYYFSAFKSSLWPVKGVAVASFSYSVTIFSLVKTSSPN